MSSKNLKVACFYSIINRIPKVKHFIGGTQVIFEYLKQFEQAKQQEAEHKDRPRIGFKGAV
jgi:hypothetical protein